MHTISPLIHQQLKALSEGELPAVTILSNASALLMEAVTGLNWAGFYLSKGKTLYLGPFQGKAACTVIPYGKGVCGTAAVTDTTQRVEDVHRFPGHIACDSASNSELVIPIHGDSGKVIGVLDLDSIHLGRFSAEDQKTLEKFVSLLEELLRGSMQLPF